MHSASSGAEVSQIKTVQTIIVLPLLPGRRSRWWEHAPMTINYPLADKGEISAALLHISLTHWFVVGGRAGPAVLSGSEPLVKQTGRGGKEPVTTLRKQSMEI